MLFFTVQNKFSIFTVQILHCVIYRTVHILLFYSIQSTNSHYLQNSTHSPYLHYSTNSHYLQNSTHSPYLHYSTHSLIYSTVHILPIYSTVHIFLFTVQITNSSYLKYSTFSLFTVQSTQSLYLQY